MKVHFWFAPKQAAWAVGNLRNPHHNAPGELGGTNGLGRFGAVVCDPGPKSVELTFTFTLVVGGLSILYYSLGTSLSA